MNFKTEFSRQFHSLRNVLLFLQIPAGMIMLLVLFLKLKYDIDTGNLTRDANAVAEQPLYIGLVSNLGILFWCASAAICFFSGWIGNKRGGASIESFLVYSGVLSVILLFDDLLQLHEDFFPEELHIPEEWILLLYTSLAIAVFFQYRAIIPSTNYLILLSCTILFGLSIAIDLFDPGIRGGGFLEDSAKFLGVLTWFGYYTSVGYECLSQKISST